MIACGLYHSLLIDPCGTVWASGGNIFGQLGLGHTKDLDTFHCIEGITDAIQVSAAEGGHHSAVLDRQGNIWIFGNDYSRIGTHLDVAQQRKMLSPTKVQNLPKITMMACGRQHSIIRDSTGNIWGAGDNSFGQLSSKEEKVMNKFVLLERPDEMGGVIKISCGYEHSMCQCETGELWGTGHNENGELGVGHNQNVSRFQRMKFLKDNSVVHSFDCGMYHTVLLDRNGGVWGTGYGGHGQLGLNDMNNRNTLTKVSNIPPMVHIVCGGNGTLMLDAYGAVYVCGDNMFGQLGPEIDFLCSPQIVAGLPRIAQGCLSYQFSMLVDEEGRVWASGCNTYGQHGKGNDKKTSNKFVEVEGIKANIMSERRFRTTKRARTNITDEDVPHLKQPKTER